MNRPIGLIVSDNDGQLRLECVSSQSALGVIRGLDGNIFTGNSVWRVGHPYDRPGVHRLQARRQGGFLVARKPPFLCNCAWDSARVVHIMHMPT